ncbi:MAG: TA system VapC family ribonuclease toxin [Gammaproteobacteria bacterium]
MTPDVNVLLAASRSDHSHHQPALRWLEQQIAACNTGGSIELLPMVAVGFLRLATNPRVFVNPMPIEAALAFLDSLLVMDGVEIPEVGREWFTLKRLSREHHLTANSIPDGWIAAAVKTLGSHLVTFDRDFTRLLSRSEVTILNLK